MRKFAVAVAVVALVAFTAPAFAATNPFMDVPMNHWAYDAIGQLAAHGILSGYPDGTYKGKQPTTRYEMASALARALAVVDMTKASKQDVEMLKKLVVEFRDELEALGVKVADLDERVSVLEDRLGGWHMHGVLRLDITRMDRDEPLSDGNVNLSRARLFFERWFGDPDNPMFFRARLDNYNNAEEWQNFYVDIPFFFDSTLTAGRIQWDMESAYYLGGDTALPATGTYAAFDSILTDRKVDALGWRKDFGLGGVYAYVAHPNTFREYDDGKEGNEETYFGAWELFAMGKFQFTEQFGFDIGGQAFLGDNAKFHWTKTDGTQAGENFVDLWTLFAGLRFNFNDSIAFKGIYYYQKEKGDDWVEKSSGKYGWREWDNDSLNHWKLIVDVDQEMLKFTSLWLEYGHFDGGFTVPAGARGQGAVFASSRNLSKGSIDDDMNYWRVALGQQWNEKWATHLFYFGYDFDRKDDLKEWGLGVQYKYNPSVSFGLNFVKVDWSGKSDAYDDTMIKFRTQVTF